MAVLFCGMICFHLNFMDVRLHHLTISKKPDQNRQHQQKNNPYKPHAYRSFKNLSLIKTIRPRIRLPDWPFRAGFWLASYRALPYI